LTKIEIINRHKSCGILIKIAITSGEIKEIGASVMGEIETKAGVDFREIEIETKVTTTETIKEVEEVEVEEVDTIIAITTIITTITAIIRISKSLKVRGMRVEIPKTTEFLT
jgi:methanogenic corrinoid protein MtbC1